MMKRVGAESDPMREISFSASTRGAKGYQESQRFIGRSSMEITLVNPPRFEGIPVVREGRCEITEPDSNIPPYSYPQLAGVLRRAGHDVKLIDANGFDIDYAGIERLRIGDSDIVFFRFTPTTFRSDIKVAEIAKLQNPDTVTIGGCWTLRTYPQSVLAKAPFLDIYCLGDPIRVVPTVAEGLAGGKGPGRRQHGENGRLEVSLKTAQLPPVPLDEIGIPPYDLLPGLDVYYS